MSYVTIRFEFEETSYEDGYVSYDLKTGRVVESTLLQEFRDGIGESLTQSDFGWINLPNGVISLLSGETEVDFRDLR